MYLQFIYQINRGERTLIFEDVQFRSAHTFRHIISRKNVTGDHRNIHILLFLLIGEIERARQNRMSENPLLLRYDIVIDVFVHKYSYMRNIRVFRVFRTPRRW